MLGEWGGGGGRHWQVGGTNELLKHIFKRKKLTCPPVPTSRINRLSHIAPPKPVTLVHLYIRLCSGGSRKCIGGGGEAHICGRRPPTFTNGSLGRFVTYISQNLEEPLPHSPPYIRHCYVITSVYTDQGFHNLPFERHSHRLTLCTVIPWVFECLRKC